MCGRNVQKWQLKKKCATVSEEFIIYKSIFQNFECVIPEVRGFKYFTAMFSNGL